MTYNATEIFAEWVEINGVLCSWRSRFDGMKYGIDNLIREKKLSKDSFSKLLKREQYDKIFPLIPEGLK